MMLQLHVDRLARRAAMTAIAGCALTFASFCFAASYPEKPIKIIVPAGAGTASDLTARYFGVGLGKVLNTPIIVENKLGAGGVIGTDFVAKAAPDGYTLLLTFSSHYINQWVMNTSFDAVRDFEPIAGLAISSMVLVTVSSSPYKSVRDVIAAAKLKPDSVSYGSAGIGGVTHMAGALFDKMAQIQLNHVPYKSAGQVPVDAAAGQVDVAFVGMTAALPLLQSGRLRALAVTTVQRAPNLPEVPTMAEAGVPGYELISRTEVLAPKGTPAEIVAKLSTAFARIANSDGFKAFCKLQACVVDARDGVTVKAGAQADLQKWHELVKLTSPKSN